ncbi:MAG: UDP-N-acetylmuramate--L-alanine ligase [Lachnospiraceae bacterium]|nr:UDP-N-acetylmuramate--L-alanine ligase [Lachnospiraceae bacterium]
MRYIDFSNPGRVHFIGIGGISMSGFAELLCTKGFTVTGSDSKESKITKRLESLGIRIFYGNRAENIPADCDVVVYTAAVKPDNPERLAAAERGIPSIERSGLVGDVMLHYKRNFSVAGTHGKTTTTSMLSLVALQAGLDPTISVGGVLDAIEGNMRNGGPDNFIIESCEYSDSFLHFHPTHAIITNVEAEHLDYFKTLENMRNSYRSFAELIPSDGLLVINKDIPDYTELFNTVKCPVITYGLGDSPADKGSAGSYYSACEISYDDYDCGRYTLTCNGEKLGEITLSVPGEHNVSNSVAVAAMALSCGISLDDIREGLSKFKGTERRFERKGEFNGVTVIDDYAHHPTEMRATLLAAQKCPHKKLWVVFQPHTYSRTISFRQEICDALALADGIVLADIYAAREKDPGTISSEMLANDIKVKNGKDVYYFPDFEKIEDFLRQNCSTGDMLITMGAGDVVNIGEALIK